jgi:RNA polymerase-binding transcription factor DksA
MSSAMAMDHTKDGRSALLERRHHLVEQVARVERDLQWFSSNVEPELLEEGQEQSLADPLERLGEHDRAALDEIDRALAHIDDGNYGVCIACGEEIPLARRRAMPATELCCPCAAMREAFEEP